MKTFAEAWADKEAEGYRYGKDALEQVRFGWELRAGEIDKLTQELDAARAYARVLAHAYQHDSRPPASVVAASLAFPVVGASAVADPHE